MKTLKIKSLGRNENCPVCRGTGKIPTTDWLTKGMTEEEIAKEKEEALADIVEVVRCKDCKYWGNPFKTSYGVCHSHNILTLQTDYCSYGERG